MTSDIERRERIAAVVLSGLAVTGSRHHDLHQDACSSDHTQATKAATVAAVWADALMLELDK